MNFIIEKNRIYVNNESNQMVAEVTFPNISDDVVEINHTFVDDSLRGQGVAGKLLEMATSKIREDHKKVKPTCSFAVKWFEKNIAYQDLLAE
ncbi:MAG: GNAT family N-acetyltransferase [Oscillospiraceae bacterium]